MCACVANANYWMPLFGFVFFLSGPVSYTHLDVYKRQTMSGSSDCIATNKKEPLLNRIPPSKEFITNVSSCSLAFFIAVATTASAVSCGVR